MTTNESPGWRWSRPGILRIYIVRSLRRMVSYSGSIPVPVQGVVQKWFGEMRRFSGTKYRHMLQRRSCKRIADVCVKRFHSTAKLLQWGRQ